MRRPNVAAGRPVLEMIKLAYAANLPVLLIGSYGIGKSALLALAAEALGILLIMRDLSLMESVDLTGLPSITPQGHTQYASPAFLPREGRGILLLEELNRTLPHVRAPCLQLLAERRLNDYRLPDGWLPVGAINPPEDEFQVDALDPALAARFLQIHVKPDVQEWVRWARAQPLHADVVEFVNMTPGMFEDAESNPRAWTYVSQMLTTWEQIESDWQCALLPAVAGHVGVHWATAFLQFYQREERPLNGEDIVRRYASLRGLVKRWQAERRTDLLQATVEGLQQYLLREAQRSDPDRLLQDRLLRRHVGQLLDDIPRDMAVLFRKWLNKENFPADLCSED
jgi:MoxR-like ATPase